MLQKQLDVFEREADVMEIMPLAPLSVKKAEQLVCVMSGYRAHLFFQRSREFIKLWKTIFANGVRKYAITIFDNDSTFIERNAVIHPA